MQHTRESLVRNRGMIIIIVVLCVIWAIEPAGGIVAETCQHLIQKWRDAR